MNTGHEGSLSTLHANTSRDAVSRLETMVLMGGLDLPMRAIREQIGSAIDLFVQISRLRDGSRKITYITEVEGLEGEIVTLTDLFVFDHSAGVDAEGKSLGSLVPTGIRPRCTERLEDEGVFLPASMFEPEGAGPRGW